MSFHRALVSIALIALGGCYRSLDPLPPGQDPPPTPSPPPIPTPPPRPGPTPPPCGDTYLGSSVPIVAAGTTLGASTVGACGVSGPGALFTWTAPGEGPYTVTVAGSFPLDVDVADAEGSVCLGPTVGCAADDGVVSFTSLPGRLIDVAVIARDGVGGPFQVTIDGPPPICGDGTCDFDEDCSSCAADCGECASSSYCGDGTCDFDEDAAFCPEDCSTCGDGICDIYEDCSSCDLDCGTCADEPCQSMTSRRVH